MAVAESAVRAGRPARGIRQLADLVVHLARRQLDSQHRFTVLGWTWPLSRQIVQLAVFVFLFSKILDLGIEGYGLFLFTGLLVWTWFSAGLMDATKSLESGRHLVFSPRFPDVALPLVAVAAPIVDLLMALPLLLLLLAIDGRLGPWALLFPVLLVPLFAFTAGLGMLASAANVFFRDVANIVSLTLFTLFYATPIFFGLRNVPERFQWVMHVNPMTAHVNAARAVLFDGRAPAVRDLLIIGLLSPATMIAGYLVFRALQPRFVDEL
jgi:lipopolysaccharide transport system permease protein